MKASISPNISLMLSSPSAVLASRITTSMTSQKISLASARTGSRREPVRPTTSSRPPALAMRLKSEPLEHVIRPALNLAGQKVAGEKNDRRADQGRNHTADLFGAHAGFAPRVRSLCDLDDEFADLVAPAAAARGAGRLVEWHRPDLPPARAFPSPASRTISAYSRRLPSVEPRMLH